MFFLKDINVWFIQIWLIQFGSFSYKK